MKLIREAALSRRRAPPFTTVVDLEVLQLRQLSPWIRWLYLELRMLSDFKTGHLVTSWAQLLAVMGCDDYQAFSPSLQAIRRAIEALEKVRLVERFPDASMATKQLFLKVWPVKGFSARAKVADRPAGRPADRPRTKQKPSKHAASSEVDASSPTDLPNEQATGDSGPGYQTPNPLSHPHLSTGNGKVGRSVDESIKSLKKTRDTIAARRGTPKNGPL